MSIIPDINEAWQGHSGLEVETFLKSQIVAAMTAAGGKIGFVDFANMTMRFWEYEGASQPLVTINLGGTIYNIEANVDLGTVFYILNDEKTKVLTISPVTTETSIGSDRSDPFPEDYVYTVAVNSGSGYITRIPETSIRSGGSSSFDIRPFLNTGDNYIRISITGTTSGQTKTTVCTATLTTLSLTVNHAWQNVWEENQPYVINGIRFSGNLVKYLHVALDGTELDAVEYSPNVSYTSTSTTYTIPATAFPASEGNGVHTVTMWMTAQGVSTPVTTYRIMCAAQEDTTPMIAVNDLRTAVNFTSSPIFSYAVYNANSATFALSATIDGTTYNVTSTPSEMIGLVEGRQYTFSYTIEVDTGSSLATQGTFEVVATPYLDSIEGAAITVQTNFDNTYSYVATPGALFHLNAATRSNDAQNRLEIINESGASQDGNFAASYNATWDGFSYNGDGWITDSFGCRALSVPAGSSLVINNFEPLRYLAAYPGLTVEMMLRSAYPSDYSEPVFSMWADNKGIRIYPTKIVVYSNLETDEITQSVNLDENRITHLCITWVKNYGETSGRNLCSIYVNGISNVNFAYQGPSIFWGPGANLTIGQQHTDAYLYRMRVYGTALSSQAVFNNFLNCITDSIEFNRREESAANNVLDGNNPGYAEVKAAGYNIMVVEMASDQQYLPSIDHPAPEDGYSGCSFRFEYGDHPEWNVTISNVSLDGQGTTSKQYFRWNLRGKTKSSTVWTYADGTSETGKKGKFAGDDYALIDRVTAKKNIASSQQGHKMGMTGLYNDLYKRVGLSSHLPNSEYRVAVYQFPFVGFRYYATNNSYEYIGLYTAGPDKGSKVTFGYSDDYPSLMSIEGPNHDPLGTRFLSPWTDVTYSPANETSMIGGVEAWDADYVNYETSDEGTQADWDAILGLYNTEWKPAYQCVYNNSPYIVSRSELITALANPSITTLSDLLNASNASTILDGKTAGYNNTLLSFYEDTTYDIYFYRTKNGRFEKLSDVDTSSYMIGNALTGLSTYLSALGYSTSNPTSAQIREARAARFKATAPDFWDMDQTIFHYCYCILFGVTDNFAKNSYPFKFRPLADAANNNDYACRWGWRQDDLDTVLATDNNGRSTKPYYVEHGDLNQSGGQIFQGGDSALWVLVRDNYKEETKAMMLRIANAASAISADLILGGDGLHETLFNVVSYYCWDHSAKYFAPMLYEKDREWSYITPWLIDDAKEYNGVRPLDQALGDQYQAERLWMERRIVYIFSKYRIGAFSGATGGYHMFSNTLGAQFTFEITPAINLYPVCSVAATDYVDDSLTPASLNVQPTAAGDTVDISVPAGGASNNYIHGMDWIASLGDLSRLVLTDRASDTNISFSVQSDRLQTLKVGDATASNVRFNATNFAVSSPSLTYLDARNTSTISNVVNLLSCPRLRTVLFDGSGALGLYLPVGAKLSTVSFPSSSSIVYLNSLPMLENSGLTLPDLQNVESLCIVNCANLNPVSVFISIAGQQNNKLKFMTIAWEDIVEITNSQLVSIANLSDSLVGYVDYSGNAPSGVEGAPIAQGAIKLVELTPMSSFAKVQDRYGSIELVESDSLAWIDFADSAVEAIALANWDSNSDGKVTLNEAKNITTVGTLFMANTNIVSFEELRHFENIKAIGASSGQVGFYGCTNLQSVDLRNIETVGYQAFMNNTALAGIGKTENVKTIYNEAFRGCSSLAIALNLPNLTTVGNYGVFYQSGITEIASLESLGTIPDGNSSYGMFKQCTSLRKANLAGIENVGNYAFDGCTSLSEIINTGDITRIGVAAFTSVNISDVNFPKLTSIGTGAFTSSKIKSITSLGSITSLPMSTTANNGMFQNCSQLKTVILPETLTYVGTRAFNGCSAIESINLPLSLEEVRDFAFYSIKGMPEVLDLPNLTALGTGAFYNCGITKIVNLGSITSIPNASAYDNGVFGRNKLTEIWLPSTLTSIGNVAFGAPAGYGNADLEFVVCKATTPPSLASNAFSNTPYTFKVYVPYSSDHSILDAYKAATNWTSLASMIYELTEEGEIPE